MLVTVVSVNHSHGSLFSHGVGRDDDGNLVNFILHSTDVPKLESDMKSNRNLKIDLAPWQFVKNKLG